jgi:hypothetical protein
VHRPGKEGDIRQSSVRADSKNQEVDGRPSIQYPGNLFNQFVLRTGLTKYSLFAKVFEDLTIAVARDEDDWQLGTCGVDRFRALNACHFGHGKIYKNEGFLLCAVS